MKMKDRTCLVYDYGLFVELAVTLSHGFGRTLYYVPWQDGYPKSNAKLIGHGVPGIKRVDSIWPYIDEIDLFVFPDVYEGPLQEHLVKLGKRVWGSRMGEELELDRVGSKNLCKTLGIDIGPFEVLTGMDALRTYLKKHDEQWVKISATRGDMETFHSKNYALAEPKLDRIAHSLGAKQKIMEFIVEAAIEPAIEVGYDGYTVDGRFAKNALIGIEVKDKAYVGRTMPYAKLPDPVRSVNEKLKPALKRYGYRGLISTEIRVTPDGKAYLIDPCARAGSPPNEVYQMQIANLPEIVWEGSEGTLIEPDFVSEWSAMLLLTSEVAMDDWVSVGFPPELRDHVKLRNLAVVEGKHYYVPDKSACSAMGAVVALGETPQQAIDRCKEIAEEVQGDGIDVACDALDKAYEDLIALLGDDKPKSKTAQKAEALAQRGAISPKQLAKMEEA